MKGAAVKSDTLSLCARFIRRNIGLHFTPERLPELGQKLRALAREAGAPDTERFLLRLMSEPLSPDRMDSLVRALTIGETYFLRDPKSYRILTDHILPALIAERRSTDRSIRIWSAGCSTGEEPYSIAILLSRALPDIEQWNISLLATDINREALRHASRGLYSQWSFRNSPPWLMDYFSDQGGGRFQIAPGIREMVRFSELNLATGSGSEEVSGMDVIFCRNVMLYFGDREIGQTMARLREALTDTGWLFIGPTEVSHTLRHGFALRHFDGAFVLNKSAAPAETAPAPSLPGTTRRVATAALVPAPPPAALAPVHLKPAGTAAIAAEPPVSLSVEDAVPGGGDPFALYRQGRYGEAAEAALAFVESGGESGEVLGLAARAWANIGRLSEARSCCERAIACDRLSAANHYLLAIILEQLGEPAAAVKSLKHALFIDHDYLVAYLALGNLFRQSGRRSEAERSFANALRLLEKRDPDEVLDEAEGMTAGRLAQAIRRGLEHRD